LNEAQRAALAHGLKSIVVRKAKENRETAGRATGRGKVLARLPEPFEPVDTRAELAKMAGLSHGTLDKAKVIHEKAPEPLKEKVRSGLVSIHAARNVIPFPTEQTDLP
jgi:hypothetical protein